MRQCVDVTHIVPELCSGTRGNVCTFTLEGDELHYTDSQLKDFVKQLEKDVKQQAKDEREGKTFPDLTGCPAVVDDPDQPLPGCTPPSHNGATK
jgi:hypothetical protein